MPNINISLAITKAAIEGVAKIYGPIFMKMAVKYALEFEAEKLGEEPPNGIETLDGTIEYIVKNAERYPNGYCSMVYAMGKAESVLQGTSGAGSKRMAFNAVKNVMEESGMVSGLKGTTDQIFDALVGFIQLSKSLGALPPFRLERQGNEAKMTVKNCAYKDACRKFAEENLLRVIGGEECIILINYSVCAEMVTGKLCDYKLEQFDEPTCKGRIYEFEKI